MSGVLRPRSQAAYSKSSPTDRRDQRFFWTHFKREDRTTLPCGTCDNCQRRHLSVSGKPLLCESQWTKGEIRRRRQFARAISNGKTGPEALVEALDLYSCPHPPSWTDEEWGDYWTPNRLQEIAERWLLHPYVQSEARFQRKLSAVVSSIREGLPEEILTEIATGKHFAPRDRASAAYQLAKIQERRNRKVDILDITATLLESAKRIEAPTSPQPPTPPP